MTAHIRIKPMVVSGHLKALRRRHRAIDGRVDTENRRLYPDSSLLQRLKRERLRLRDELARYERLRRGALDQATPA